MKWIRKIRPKMITDFTNNKKETIGKGIGIFTPNSNKLSKEELIEGILKGVEKFKSSKSRNIVLYNLDILELKDFQYIEKKTGLRILNGKQTMVEFLPMVLKELSTFLERKLIDEEILIISDNSFLTYDLIKDLSNRFKFLTIVGNDGYWIEDISKKIYDTTGLSIFYTRDINRILKNYSIIINLNEDVLIDIYKLKSTTIVFDLSIKKLLARRVNSSNKNILVIEDFLFSCEELLLERKIFDLGKEVPSYKYEVFQDNNIENFRKVVVNIEEYTLRDLAYKKIKKRSNI
ncbi:hypothetical protein NSA23_16280 [Anaerosalibacter massiliensis]|uniref:Uncharacterized protein n=1 Tax=Anaerosalibacter massiliensis TaxID=1347392 RepID=A0A9X2S6R0_9FIRM|nr:hypothetical protein [Anaerosalibacter massiliensis]MCR2045644.1 hypothetical protein [Anaerosalibacter massiliensis]